MYFDDASITDLKSACGSGQWATNELFAMVGSPFATEKKQPMQPTGTFLGLTHDFSPVASHNVVTFWARDRLHDKVRDIIRHARDTQTFTRGTASKLYGIANFLEQGIYGRVGYGGLMAIKARQDETITTLTPDICACFEVIEAVMRFCPKREFSVLPFYGERFLAASDAAIEEDTGGSGGFHLIFFQSDSSQIRLSFVATNCTELQFQWQPAVTHIAQLELAMVLYALVERPDLFRGRRGLWFLDNVAAGYWEYVQSKSNWADDISRLGFDDPWWRNHGFTFCASFLPTILFHLPFVAEHAPMERSLLSPPQLSPKASSPKSPLRRMSRDSSASQSPTSPLAKQTRPTLRGAGAKAGKVPTTPLNSPMASDEKAPAIFVSQVRSAKAAPLTGSGKVPRGATVPAVESAPVTIFRDKGLASALSNVPNRSRMGIAPEEIIPLTLDPPPAPEPPQLESLAATQGGGMPSEIMANWNSEADQEWWTRLHQQLETMHRDVQDYAQRSCPSRRFVRVGPGQLGPGYGWLVEPRTEGMRLPVGSASCASMLAPTVGTGDALGSTSLGHTRSGPLPRPPMSMSRSNCQTQNSWQPPMTPQTPQFDQPGLARQMPQQELQRQRVDSGISGSKVSVSAEETEDSASREVSRPTPPPPMARMPSPAPATWVRAPVPMVFQANPSAGPVPSERFVPVAPPMVATVPTGPTTVPTTVPTTPPAGTRRPAGVVGQMPVMRTASVGRSVGAAVSGYGHPSPMTPRGQVVRLGVQQSSCGSVQHVQQRAPSAPPTVLRCQMTPRSLDTKLNVARVTIASRYEVRRMALVSLCVEQPVISIYTAKQVFRSLVGTLEVMAPERVKALHEGVGSAGSEYGPESDLWSLGVVLYELALLHAPFSEDRPDLNAQERQQRLIDRIQHDKPSPLPFSRAAVLHKVVIGGLLQKQPSQRPSAAELCQDPDLGRSIHHFLQKQKLLDHPSILEILDVLPSVEDPEGSFIASSLDVVTLRSHRSSLGGTGPFLDGARLSATELRKLLPEDLAEVFEPAEAVDNSDNSVPEPGQRQRKTSKGHPMAKPGGRSASHPVCSNGPLVASPSDQTSLSSTTSTASSPRPPPFPRPIPPRPLQGPDLAWPESMRGAHRRLKRPDSTGGEESRLPGAVDRTSVSSASSLPGRFFRNAESCKEI
eukprot:s1456_g19.t1